MSQNQQMKLPQLKPNVTVIVPIGSAFINKIQECYHHHVEGHEEDLKNLQARNGDYSTTPLTPWENTALMYYTLLQEILKIAEANKQLDYVDVSGLIVPNSPLANLDPR